MSRFSGWTMKDVEKLTGVCSVKSEVKKTIKRKVISDSPDYVSMISGALTILGVKHEREYKFLHDRRFRFDIALPKKKIAVEFEGGIFSGGRHTRGKGYSSDAKKYNLAVRHGWRLLRFTSAEVSRKNWEFMIADEIKSLIEK